MRLLVYADPHWSVYSSIIRSRDIYNGKEYSTRLIHLIQSISWVESMAEKHRCDAIICLGDFFDKESLNSEEISALSDVVFSSNIPHYFIVGNHEIGRGDGSFSSSFLMRLCPNTTVFDSVNKITVDGGKTELCFIPYMLKKEINLYDVIGEQTTEKRIVFSHNDILGINYGAYISESGVDVTSIDRCCDLYINGHIHNGSCIGNKIINVGNLVGQNFSEDSFKYEHRVAIIDTENATKDRIEYIENPYSFNFYIMNFCNNSMEYAEKEIKSLKDFSVVSVKISESQLKIKEIVESSEKIVGSRIIIERSIGDSNKNQDENSEDTSGSHIDIFMRYIGNCFGDDKLAIEELSEICK